MEVEKNIKNAMAHRIIVALDGISEKKALSVAKKLRGLVWGFKVNDLLFGSPGIIKKLKKYGKVFADAKLYDIPNTVSNSVKRLSTLGADIITVHASGGVEMMRAAKKAAGKSKIIAVTILTSHKERTGFNKLLKDAQTAGVDGIICSAYELKFVKGNLLKIVPGIRPGWYKKKDDQKVTITPKEAIRLRADYIIIGRPILDARDPVKAFMAIQQI